MIRKSTLANTALSATALLLLATVGTAQVRLPSQPGGITPTTPQVAEPLRIVEAPSGELLVPAMFGWTRTTPDAPVIRTTGGVGTVTLSIETSARTPDAFTLFDPPQSDDPRLQLAQPVPESRVLGNSQAASVTRQLGIRGFGTISQSFPAPHDLTIVARDSRGTTVRRTFRVVYTRAEAFAPRVAAPIKKPLSDIEHVSEVMTAAQLAVTPKGRLITRAQNQFTLRSPTSGVPLNWHASDPGSEIICVYGTFRYTCELASGLNQASLAQSIDVTVPNIGRGTRVGIILKNPYGESAPAFVTIDTETTATLREEAYFHGPTAGKSTALVSPGDGLNILANGRTKPCDRGYLIWKDLKTDGRMTAGGLIGGIDLKLAGDAKVRVLSVPRGQPITDDYEASWARIERDVPPGLAQKWLYDLTYTYEYRIGECPAKRR